MAQDVQFSHGNPLMIPYTPGADGVSGVVLVVGNIPMVAHHDLVNGRPSDLACGGGVYRCTVAGAYGAGVDVWWDNTAKKMTTTATSNKHFGFTAEASGADGDVIMVVHAPLDSLAG